VLDLEAAVPVLARRLAGWPGQRCRQPMRITIDGWSMPVAAMAAIWLAAAWWLAAGALFQAGIRLVSWSGQPRTDARGAARLDGHEVESARVRPRTRGTLPGARALNKETFRGPLRAGY
jgi:hypothetical protein